MNVTELVGTYYCADCDTITDQLVSHKEDAHDETLVDVLNMDRVEDGNPVAQPSEMGHYDPCYWIDYDADGVEVCTKCGAYKISEERFEER